MLQSSRPLWELFLFLCSERYILLVLFTHFFIHFPHCVLTQVSVVNGNFGSLIHFYSGHISESTETFLDSIFSTYQTLSSKRSLLLFTANHFLNLSPPLRCHNLILIILFAVLYRACDMYYLFSASNFPHLYTCHANILANHT